MLAFGLTLLAAVPVGLSACGGDPAEVTGERTPREGYPSGPFGVDKAAIIADLTFVTPDGGSFGLSSDVFQPGARVLLLATAAEWCTACREEAPKLQALKDEYGAQGLDVVVAMFEDAEFNPAGASNAARWIDQYDVDYPVVADPEFQMEAYYDPQLTPLVMVVDADTMEIKYKSTGFREADVRANIKVLLR
jgi:thiol-disulfide isomerase/thioredoxin